jgi:antagonist of KipI
MSIRILKQGLFDTLQDEGRYGYQHLGINPGGAMDIIAAGLANMLVGNELNEAVIEMHFPAPTIYFEKAAVIALSGADFSVEINGKDVPINTTIIVATNSTLSFKRYLTSARLYLAIQGGFSIEPWLNSYSTNIKAKSRGYYGRALKKDDVLHLRAEQFGFTSLPKSSVTITSININPKQFYNSSNIIRCVPGKDFESLTLNSKKAFIANKFNINRQSDRMGYRVEGDTLECANKSERISAAVTKGSIQLLPSGELILLMSDHQTTGGYPVIAHVISADIPTLAQMQPGNSLQFQLTDIEKAEMLYIEQQRNLQQLQQQCNLQLKQFFS